MSDDYHKRVAQHYQEVEKAQGELMAMAQRLSPGYWVLQYTFQPCHPKREEQYTAWVSNGDDNVTAVGRTLGGAIARLIGGLLDGGVFPLTGQHGRYIAEQDREYVQERERKSKDEMLKVLYAAEDTLMVHGKFPENMPTLKLLRDKMNQLQDS